MQYESNYLAEDELMHYGVIGMKWGVRRYRTDNKFLKNQVLKKRIQDKESLARHYKKKAEKAHSKYDLEQRNEAAMKAIEYRKKAAKNDIKAENINNSFGDKDRFMAKAEKLRYKAAKKEIEANSLSRSVGYGTIANRYANKADVALSKAAKARMQITNNNRYINTIERKFNATKGEERKEAKKYYKRRTG